VRVHASPSNKEKLERNKVGVDEDKKVFFLFTLFQQNKLRLRLKLKLKNSKKQCFPPSMP
jgi:hypothetical protein